MCVARVRFFPLENTPSPIHAVASPHTRAWLKPNCYKRERYSAGTGVVLASFFFFRTTTYSNAIRIGRRTGDHLETNVRVWTTDVPDGGRRDCKNTKLFPSSGVPEYALLLLLCRSFVLTRYIPTFSGRDVFGHVRFRRRRFLRAVSPKMGIIANRSNGPVCGAREIKNS